MYTFFDIVNLSKSRQNWKKDKNNINLSNMRNVEFETLLYPFLKFNSLRRKIMVHQYPIKMNTLQIKCIKIGWKFKKFIFNYSPFDPFYVKNGNRYIMTLCMFLKGIFLRNALKKILIKNKWTINNVYSLGLLFLLFTSDQQQLNINYVGDHLLNIPTKLVPINWRGGSRKED
jgi:hypothetical protein